ncbi:Hypothetical predicted protein [Marmota monax]|uniref:Uncharacterized protein n=1 Tax=Marmota monax TaxID=9995 RepID=A0A5E4AHP5_MARMO|nr:Hypothetical predicted protein [Marmota monax]
MPPPAGKCSSEQVGKSASGSGPREERAKRVPATKPGWTLTLEGLAAMSPTQRHRHLLFGDLLKDVGAAASIFPRESVELEYLVPDPRTWTQCELPTERWNRLLGVLKAAEARGRVRALRLRYTRMRGRRPSRRSGQRVGTAEARRRSAGFGPQAEEIALLIQRQGSARAAIRLETFLPPQLKPTRIPDPLDRQEVLASPGWVGGPLASSHTDPRSSPCSGGVWRPFWRRRWMAASSHGNQCHGGRHERPPDWRAREGACLNTSTPSTRAAFSAGHPMEGCILQGGLHRVGSYKEPEDTRGLPLALPGAENRSGGKAEHLSFTYSGSLLPWASTHAHILQSSQVSRPPRKSKEKGEESGRRKDKGEQGDGGLGQGQINRDMASEDNLCPGTTASPGILQSSSLQFALPQTSSPRTEIQGGGSGVREGVTTRGGSEFPYETRPVPSPLVRTPHPSRSIHRKWSTTCRENPDDQEWTWKGSFDHRSDFVVDEGRFSRRNGDRTKMIG